jgi:2-polyprenyl-3-methyl-5-hydroxy-6-metoxy-1,4-benzoquinol methylase
MNTELEFELSGTLKKRDNIKIAEADEKKRALMVSKIIPDRRYNHVLDIGCGIGTCMKMLVPRSGKITGIDVYAIGAEINPDLDIRKFDLNSGKLPFDDKTFDLVVATEVIEHTYYPHSVLRDIKRVLKDDGFTCISLPNAQNIYNRRDILFGKTVTDHGFDSFAHHYFTNIKQNRELVSSEFKIIKEMYQWIDEGKAGLISKFIRKPELFAFSIMFLCKNREQDL